MLVDEAPLLVAPLCPTFALSATAVPCLLCAVLLPCTTLLSLEDEYGRFPPTKPVPVTVLRTPLPRGFLPPPQTVEATPAEDA